MVPRPWVINIFCKSYQVSLEKWLTQGLGQEKRKISLGQKISNSTINYGNMSKKLQESNRRVFLQLGNINSIKNK